MKKSAEKEKIILFGTGDLAEQMYRYVCMDERYETVAFTVENDYIKDTVFCGIPVIDFDHINDFFKTSDVKILVCIGYNNMNKTRQRIFNEIKKKGFEIASYIHPMAEVLTKNIGEGNIILENTNIGVGAKIGDGNIIYNNVVICHDVNIGNFNSISPASVFLGFSSVGNNCFIGGNSTLKNNVQIADYTLIGASAYVSKNTDEAQVVLPNRSTIVDEKTSFDFLI